MANLQHLIDGAGKATGDTIEVAGLFEPKGLKGKQIGGSLVGAVAGDVLGGAAVGAAVGGVAGTASGAKDGTLRFVVALSSTKVYVLKPEHFDSLHKEDLELIATFDRATVEVTIHGRVEVRTLVLEDPTTGTRIELEGSRYWYEHTKPVIDALLGANFEEKESALDA